MLPYLKNFVVGKNLAYPEHDTYTVYVNLTDGTEIAYFSITPGNNHTWSMNISVEEKYQGLGISAKMIHYCCEQIDQLHVFRDQKLFIDTDANTDFWVGHLGMQVNPDLDTPGAEGNGYELVTTFGHVHEWSIRALESYKRRFN